MHAASPTPSTASADVVHYDLSAVRQANSIRWNRPGAWTPVRLDSRDPRLMVGLVARDRIGDRLLVADPSAGYRVSLVRLDCAHGGLAPLGTRVAANDADAIDPRAADSRALSPVVQPGEVARLCRGAPPVARGRPSDAVSVLRDAAMRSVERPARPGAEERARQYREYLARQKADGPAKAP